MSEGLTARDTLPSTRQRGLSIAVGAAAGYGLTELSAFDSALQELGVENRNLLKLSSVIPPGSTISEPGGRLPPYGAWGDRLYVVMAEMRTSTRDAEVHAGIAWAQDETGRGIFVEHAGHSEQQVRSELEHTLQDMCDHRAADLRPGGVIVTGATCTNDPVCALAVAVYGSEPWSVDTAIDLRSPSG